ncbi:cell envelope integrity protein TolA [Sphingopyxis solisilvae]|uniref:cell envelope integrity protein TolA n=1 Tax=Sphingopyxis solisilvae TaxID=1886788 RepID=UPI001892D1FF|nr:cell envelope integrity protein TolA [Sphingopyxis solisilvae]
MQIVFSREGQEGTGRATGFARAPYSDGEVIASRITGDGAGCRFKAQCGTITSTSNPCTVVVDPAQNRLTIEGGAKSFVSDVPWTRGTAAPAAAVCTRADIEGDWHRSDGALVPIVGVDAFARGDGGNALLYNHPENWPKGQSKFRGIYRVGGAQSCQLKAVCAGYDRNSRTGAVTRNERACELTIDPVRGTLRESGSTLTYRRDGRGGAATPAPAPVPEPKVSAEELAATRSLNADQAATAKREIERYEADKKRIADEQAANEAAYRKALADREALIAENDRKAREAMRKWEADVAACKAGDRSKCAPGPN